VVILGPKNGLSQPTNESLLKFCFCNNNIFCNTSAMQDEQLLEQFIKIPPFYKEYVVSNINYAT